MAGQVPLIVFAKAPLPGRVKSRLGLAPAIAAALHLAFVADLLDALAAWPAAVELHTDEPTTAWPGFSGPRRIQCAGSLGDRMLHAVANGPALLIGSDAPHLPPTHLAGLAALDADVALGPAEDGGYWGILCRRTHPRMFDGVAWSTASALADTIAACHACGLGTALGPSWWDVDDRASLERLRPVAPPRTARLLAGLAAGFAD